MRRLPIRPILAVAAFCGGLECLPARDSQLGQIQRMQGGLFDRTTASGERYDPRAYTGSHADLPFGSIVRVSNHSTGRMVDVRVIDRKARNHNIVQLSQAAADYIGVPRIGTANGSLQVLAIPNRAMPRPPAAAPPQTTRPFSANGGTPVPQAREVAAPRKIEVIEKKPGILGGIFGQKQSRQEPVYNVGQIHTFPMSAPAGTGAVPVGSPPIAPERATRRVPTYQPAPAPVAVSHRPVPVTRSPQAAVTRPMAAASPGQSASLPGYPYRVQFGAFGSTSNASESAARLRNQGIAASVLPARSGQLQIVLTAGGFATANDAQLWLNDAMTRYGLTERPVVVRY
ncbi:MAG: RlpA-like double-psi beta-barrel domain-containing protein [Verrucomicrobiota bacterium]